MVGIGIFAYHYFSAEKLNPTERYRQEMSVFIKNETESLKFYEHMNTHSTHMLMEELEDDVIPKWEENIRVVKRASQIKKLPPELVTQNELLLQYAELRLSAFRLFLISISKNTDKHRSELERIHAEIGEVLKKLNEEPPPAP